MVAGGLSRDAELQAASGTLWAVCYRMTGCAADADDLVQETFARALESPPADTGAPWKPWLVKVAMNLARDLLRRRRRAPYVGPWLPSPVETAAPDATRQDPEARAALAESVSYAYLIALEALTPQQRAVLVLREVLEYSVAETAAALSLGEANVKVSHHRARRALKKGRTDHLPGLPLDDVVASVATPAVPALDAPAGRALARFLEALRAGDGPGLAALLAEDVRSFSDGGGEVMAAVRPIRGRDAVAHFFLGLAKLGRSRPLKADWRWCNGSPALILEFATWQERQAPRALWRCELDAGGRIRELHLVLAPRKLTAVRACA